MVKREEQLHESRYELKADRLYEGFLKSYDNKSCTRLDSEKLYESSQILSPAWSNESN